MMTEIIIKQMPLFKKAYKKLPLNYKVKVGEEKKGDLSGVYVYKFKIHHQEYLLAYEWIPQERLLLALGVHENFYRDLKKS
jgi:hypothetical protein